MRRQRPLVGQQRPDPRAPATAPCYAYDGFDRLTSVIDAVGNQTVYQYDPDGNVVRTLHFGPMGGPSPTSDGPNALPGPVSSTGVIQTANLVSSNLLSATESSYDELGRAYQTSQVLFVNTIPTVPPGRRGRGGRRHRPGEPDARPDPGDPRDRGVTILGRVSDRTEYDRDSRVTFTVAGRLATTRTFYDGVGRRDQDGRSPGEHRRDGLRRRQQRHRDPRDRRLPGRRRRPTRCSSPRTSTTASNRLQETVDNLGETTYYRYDSRGNLVAMADADGPAGPAITRRAFPDGPRPSTPPTSSATSRSISTTASTARSMRGADPDRLGPG